MRPIRTISRPASRVADQHRPRTGSAGPGRLGRDLVTLVRPGQWVKNLIVVPVPLIDQESWRLASIWQVGWAVLTFTVAATMVYIVNDIFDRHRDRGHPTKRHRPIAAGHVSVPTALVLVVSLGGLLLGLVSLQPWSWSWPIAAYLLLSFAYSMGLKHVPPVDVFVVASGFALRLTLGYVAVQTEISGWLLTCVFSLCLLLTVGKRRQELAATRGEHRPALRGYTIALADQLMVLSAVITAGTYLLYLRTEAPLGDYGLAAAVLAAPLALFGLFRYLQLISVHQSGENPVRTLLRDPPLVGNSLVWMVVSGSFLLASHISQT